MNLKKKKYVFWIFTVLILAISVLVIYGVWIEPSRIEIHHIWIQDAGLGKVLEKKIIVQLSDLHIGKIGRQEQKVLKILNELKPDFIFLTGDYVKWNGDYESALTFLSKLKAKIGIWAVMGEYDYSSSRKSCLFCHEEDSGRFTQHHSIRFLRDSFEPFHLQNGTLFIEGFDFKKEYTGSYKVKSLPLKMIEPAIILSHNPLAFDIIDEDQNLFILAGDTHGGQVPLPSWLSRIMGYKKNAFYSQGLFEKGHKKMFVNRGIGTSHLPIRIFRRPEVVVLHFMP